MLLNFYCILVRVHLRVCACVCVVTPLFLSIVYVCVSLPIVYVRVFINRVYARVCVCGGMCTCFIVWIGFLCLCVCVRLADMAESDSLLFCMHVWWI